MLLSLKTINLNPFQSLRLIAKLEAVRNAMGKNMEF